MSYHLRNFFTLALKEGIFNSRRRKQERKAYLSLCRELQCHTARKEVFLLAKKEMALALLRYPENIPKYRRGRECWRKTRFFLQLTLACVNSWWQEALPHLASVVYGLVLQSLFAVVAAGLKKLLVEWPPGHNSRLHEVG